MLKLFVSVFFCLAFSLSFSQDSFKKIATHKVDGELLAIDKFSNCYAAGNNSLLKFSSDGELLFPYEEFRYGKMGSIDVTNPLKIVVFFPDVMKAVILDKFLSPLTVYDFLQLGYPAVSAVCGSTDGRIWFYDNVNMQLKKIDETGRILREGQRMNTQLSTPPIPNFLLEYENLVFMNDSTQGIFVFDVFGSYKKLIPIKGLTSFQAFENTLIYFNDKQLVAYNLQTLQSVVLSVPSDENNLKRAAIGKNIILVSEQQKIEIYSTKK